MKKIEDLKEFEFSELLSNTKFESVEDERKRLSQSYLETGIDEDGDEIREDIIEDEKKRNSYTKKNKLHKYLSFATGFAYTILSPVILLLGIYFVLERMIGFKRSELTIIILIFLGILAGYWTLFKDIKKITTKKGKENNEGEN